MMTGEWYSLVSHTTHLLLPSPSAVTTGLSLHQDHSHSPPDTPEQILDPSEGQGRERFVCFVKPKAP